MAEFHVIYALETPESFDFEDYFGCTVDEFRGMPKDEQEELEQEVTDNILEQKHVMIYSTKIIED